MSKTWFLAPNFTFLPDGPIGLGSVISAPRRPTATLASLHDHPAIVLPPVKSLQEKNLNFTRSHSYSLGLDHLAQIPGLAHSQAQVDASWHRSKSFGTMDHEVRFYSGVFRPDTLREIVRLDGVEQHVKSGRFGKRCVYVVTGLRVALQSFSVSDERGREIAASLGASAAVAASPLPLEVGGSISQSAQKCNAVSYETAPGIVFAYQLHVIRPKGGGLVQGELFTDRSAFFTGNGDEQEAETEEVLEAVEVDEDVLWQDLDISEDDHGEATFRTSNKEAYIV